MKELLLLSGGMDSTALAAMRRPDRALFVDYGQRPAAGELAAALAIGREAGIAVDTLVVDCRVVGSGLLAGRPPPATAPSPEWWPYRNQLLVTLAAGWGLARGFERIVVGSVLTDRDRHTDGSPGFYDMLDKVLRMQEGGMRVIAPAVDRTTAELVTDSQVTDQVLSLTHSCHQSPIACGFCPGCEKRRGVLVELRRLQ